jgi:hypothetical protein
LIHGVSPKGGTNALGDIGKAAQVDDIGIEFLRQVFLMDRDCYKLFRTVEDREQPPHGHAAPVKQQ